MRPMTGLVLATALLTLPQTCTAQSVQRLASIPQGPAAETQESSAPAQWHFSHELFQMLLEESGLEVVHEADKVLTNPASSVIVLLGKVPPGLIKQKLEAYVNRGGALLIATDHFTQFDRWFVIQAGPLETQVPTLKYSGHADVLRLRQNEKQHPLMAGVSSIVVNRSGWISNLRGFLGTWNVALRVPANSIPFRARSEPIVATQTVRNSTASRVVIAADHSLFTNGMLWHGDNAMFAINVCKYLTEGGRRQLLFMRDGRILSSFREQLAKLPPFPMSSPPPEVSPQLDAEQILQVVNKTVAKVEDADLLNALVANRPRRIPTRYYHRGLLFALVAGLISIAAVYWLTKSQAVTQPIAARHMRAPRAIARGSIDSNNPAGVRRAEAARLIATDFLTRLTKSTDPAHWQAYIAKQFQNERTARTLEGIECVAKLERILQTATALDTHPISRQSLLDVNEMVDRLSVPSFGEYSGSQSAYPTGQTSVG